MPAMIGTATNMMLFGCILLLPTETFNQPAWFGFREQSNGRRIHPREPLLLHSGMREIGRAWFRKDQGRANNLVARGALPALAEPETSGLPAD
jgi:hypothetical protein